MVALTPLSLSKYMACLGARGGPMSGRQAFKRQVGMTKQPTCKGGLLENNRFSRAKLHDFQVSDWYLLSNSTLRGPAALHRLELVAAVLASPGDVPLCRLQDSP